MTKSEEPRDQGDDEDVADLLRNAGPRPAPSDAVRNRIETSVHNEWRRSVRRRAALRLGAWLSSFAAVAAALVLLVRWPTPVETSAATIAQLAQSKGDASYTVVGDAERQLAEGDPIAAGSRVATRDGFARIAMSDGAELRLDRFTTITLEGPRHTELTSGRVYAETQRGGSLEVTSPVGRVTDVGTRFEVALADGRLTTSVRDGAVRLDTATDTATANVQDRIGGVLSTDGGSIETGRRPTFAAEWEWIDQIEPGYPTADSVDALLAAIADDLGVELIYASAAAKEIAANAHVEGHLDRVAPRSALEIVLASSALIEKGGEPGVLMIDTK